jgi:hypothetical protein
VAAGCLYFSSSCRKKIGSSSGLSILRSLGDPESFSGGAASLLSDVVDD